MAEPEIFSRKNLSVGVCLVLASSLVRLGNNYAIKWAGLQASEVTMCRGAIQSVIFSVILCYRRRKKVQQTRCETQNLEENIKDPAYSKSCRPKRTVLLIAYGVSTATMSFACLTAIRFMPIGDYIAVCFVSPAISVFLERIILKTPLTILTILLR